MTFWGRALATAFFLACVALVAGAVGGATAAFATLSALLAILVWRHLRRLKALEDWLKDPERKPIPPAQGSWEETLARLHRFMRNQRQDREQLSAAVERFQSASGAMPEGVVILDAENRIEWCNARAGEHLALDAARDRGGNIGYLVRQPAFLAYLSSQPYPEPLVFKPTHRTDLTLSLMVVPFDTAHKLLISTDITQLERVERVRRDFVANVSHELRTPLTVVGGFLESLNDMGEVAPEQLRHALALMTEQTRRMQRLVEDLLILSRLEGGRQTVAEERVDMAALARRVLEDGRALSGGRHDLALDLTSSRWVLGSQDELLSALGNLVSNAVRYTPDGGRITLRWHDSGPQAVFSVRDTGIGVARHHIARLTERFYRVDGSRSRETGGTGLGLAIVKHVVTRHQARLEIASEPGRGSEFSIVFPPQRVRENVPAAAEA